MLNGIKIRLWHVYIVLVLFLILASLFIPSDDAFFPKHKIQDPAKAILDIIDSIVKLVLTLTTTMLGAAAALTLKGNTWTASWKKADSALIVAVFLCGAISYFGVYLCYIRTLTMVNASYFNALEGGLVWSIRLQYLGIIFGVSCLGLVFARIIDGRLPATATD